MNFFLSNNGQTVGPYSTEQIRIFLKQGLVTTNDQVRANEWPEWITIGNVPGLAPTQPTQHAVPSSGSKLPVVPPPTLALIISEKESVGSSSVPQSFGLSSWFRGDVATVVIGLLIGIVALHFGLFSGSKANSISSVLKQNAVIQNNYNTEKNEIKITSDSDIDNLAQITKDYASQLTAIDTSGCPLTSVKLSPSMQIKLPVLQTHSPSILTLQPMERQL